MTNTPDAEAIQAALSPAMAKLVERVEVFDEIDSTSTYLLSAPPAPRGRFRAALARTQTAGRGRRHREWLSAPGAGMYLSVAHTFERPPAHLPALTLAVGVGVSRALRLLGADTAMLKWPNDVVAMNGKLGGILIEAQHRGNGDMAVVAGLGVNVDLPDRLLGQVDSAWVAAPIDLKTVAGRVPALAELTAAMIEAICGAISRYAEHGFESMIAEWRDHDWLLGRQVSVDTEHGVINGVATGVDGDGALLVDGGDGAQRIISGTVRAAEGSAST